MGGILRAGNTRTAAVDAAFRPVAAVRRRDHARRWVESNLDSQEAGRGARASLPSGGMRTHRPDDMDATGPIPLPGAHLRDAGRRRITGATSWSAIGGAALAVTFGALFAQATANAEAEKAPAE